VDRRDVALLLGVYATFALDTYSTLNSSPQTTELFAKDREDSLMHWVLIGDAAALVGGVLGSWVDGSLWPLIGAGFIMLLMHGLYRHAVKRGQDKAPPAGSD
jgi:hypothetical protein